MERGKLAPYDLAAAAGQWDLVMDILEPPEDPLDYEYWPGSLMELGYWFPELTTQPRYRAALERMGLEISSFSTP